MYELTPSPIRTRRKAFEIGDHLITNIDGKMVSVTVTAIRGGRGGDLLKTEPPSPKSPSGWAGEAHYLVE